MSSRLGFTFVFDLREDTPPVCVEVVQWLVNPASTIETRPPLDFLDETWKFLEYFIDHPFLMSLPNEEVITLFQRRYRYTMAITEGGRDVYRYALHFSARGFRSDGFFEDLYPFFYWLASFIEDGFIGYY